MGGKFYEGRETISYILLILNSIEYFSYNRHLLKKIQETLYIGQWCLSPFYSRHLRTSHSSPGVSSTVQNTLQNPLLESPSAAPSYFPESHPWSEISSIWKVILVLVKAKICRAPNLGCRGAESPGWFDVLTKIPARDVMHEHLDALSWWSCQLPVARSWGHFHHTVTLKPMKDSEVVLLINCLACRGTHVVENTFPIKTHS